MNPWIDVAVYSTQLIVCLLFTSRWAGRFKGAVVVDRNPEWAAAHPQTIADLGRSSGWNLFIQAWALFSVLVLLAYQLDLEPATMKSPGTPGWRTLLATAYLLLGIGFALFGLAAVGFTRWLKASVPLAERRHASLTPRSLDAFVPRWLKLVVFGILIASVAARPVASLFYPERVADVRAGFIFSLTTAGMLFLTVGISVRRRPTVFDRVLGSGYRKREVRACFALMAFHGVGGLAMLGLEISGIDARRFSGVIFSAVVTAVLASLMPVPPRSDANGPTLRVAWRR
jgi:hypothetical protein